MAMFLCPTLHLQYVSDHTQYSNTLWDLGEPIQIAPHEKLRYHHTVIDGDKPSAIRLGAVLLANWSVDASVLNKNQGSAVTTDTAHRGSI